VGPPRYSGGVPVSTGIAQVARRPRSARDGSTKVRHAQSSKPAAQGDVCPAAAEQALLEPIPDRTAMREGATHVLVLRSRDATYRAPRHGKLAERTLARAHPELVPLLRMSSARDNLDAVGLERRAWRSSGVPHVRQIAVPTGSRLVSRFRIDHPRIADSVRQRARTTELATTPRPAA
jgi:hypothetical protein